MPKKSKRRAKAGRGSGGGGKVPGGGGSRAGRGADDTKTQTAKNSDDENKNSAGILTAGAVRMSWSYEKKLRFVREHTKKAFRIFGDDGSGDVGAVVRHVSSYFQLPREQTEPFRAAMLMHWRVFLGQWLFIMRKRNGAKVTAEMVADYERSFANERSVGLLKRLSSVEGGESAPVRAVASFIRGRTGIGFTFCYGSGGSLSNALSSFLRFSVLVDECDRTELASTFDEITGEGGPLVGKSVIERLSTDCTNYLSVFGGPSQRQISTVSDLSSDDLPFFLTAGGNFCDCCGKTPEDANLPVLFKCKACRLAWYCSASCQAECWADGHRGCCKKFGRFEKGDQVILLGLKKRPGLNGTLVSVEDLPLNDRAAVRILWPTNRSVQVGALLSIKKENLKHHRPLK